MSRINYFKKYLPEDKFKKITRKLFKRSFNLPKSTQNILIEKIMTDKRFKPK